MPNQTTPIRQQAEREHIERLQAMAEDDGDTWDLSDNDKAAIRFALKELAARDPRLPPQDRLCQCGHPWSQHDFSYYGGLCSGASASCPCSNFQVADPPARLPEAP